MRLPQTVQHLEEYRRNKDHTGRSEAGKDMKKYPLYTPR